MKINKIVLAFIVSIIMLSGCSSTDKKEGSLLESNVEKEGKSLVTTALNTPALSGEQMLTQGLTDSELSEGGLSRLGAEFSDPANPLSKQTIYFTHDSSQVQQQFVHIVAAHAQYLLAHPEQRVTIEGHTDELGSREYNIALGEQRAKSVNRMMKVQGVSNQQLEVVSYGEEKPASDASGEVSWQLNRRVEIVYQVQ